MDKIYFSSKETEMEIVNQNWGSLRWIVNGQKGNSKSLTFGRVVIKKGCSNPRHAHTNCEEILYLLKGRLRHTISTNEVLMEPGDTIVMPEGVMHNAYSIGEEDADMIVVYSSAQRDFVKE